MTYPKPRAGLFNIFVAFAWALCFLLLFPFLAFADAPVVLGAPPTGIDWGQAILKLVALLIPAFGALTIAALGYLTTFLRAKGRNSRIASAFAVAADYIEAAFVHVRAGIEDQLRAALADGTLDSTERAALVAKLVLLVKAELPGGIQTVLAGVLGSGLETWLSGKAGQVVQAAVDAGKATPAGTVAAAVALVPQKA